MSEDEKVIRLVVAAERQAVEEAREIGEARDAAHKEAEAQLEVAAGMLRARRCRGMVIAAIFEEPSGSTAMFTSVPKELAGIYTSGVLGAVHHAAFRLHCDVDSMDELPMPTDDGAEG